MTEWRSEMLSRFRGGLRARTTRFLTSRPQRCGHASSRTATLPIASAERSDGRKLDRVRPEVDGDMVLALEGGLAERAPEGPLPGVGAKVPGEVATVHKGLATEVAPEGALARVHAHVAHQCGLGGEGRAAQGAPEGASAGRVAPLVQAQLALHVGREVALATRQRPGTLSGDVRRPPACVQPDWGVTRQNRATCARVGQSMGIVRLPTLSKSHFF